MSIQNRKFTASAELPCSTTMLARAIREDAREVDFVCSTEALDSHGTIISQNGWDFSRFGANPVVLFAHKADKLPVGHATRYAVDGGKLIATVRFSSEKANPLSEQVWQSILERSLRGISVGFLPLEYHFEVLSSGEEILVFDRQLLLELSVTPLPSNGDALAKVRAWAASSAVETPNSPGRTAPANEETMSTPDTTKQAAPSDAEAKIRTLETELANERTALATERLRASEVATKVEALETQNRRLVTEREDAIKARETAEKRVAELEDQAVEREVDALIGKKISKDERASFVKLRKADHKLFEEMVAQRKDMKLTEQVIESDGNAAPTPSVDARAAAADSDEKDFAELVRGAAGTTVSLTA